MLFNDADGQLYFFFYFTGIFWAVNNKEMKGKFIYMCVALRSMMAAIK
jgi:hypothetical protein